jgi:hypothetical protein
VKAPSEGDDIAPTRGVTGQFHGALNGLGTAIAEEEMIQLSRHELKQFGDKVEKRLVVYEIQLTVNQPSHLLSGGSDDAWVAVTGVGDTNTRGEVEIAPAVGGI